MNRMTRLGILLLLLAVSLGVAATAHAANRIFLLDTSGSMAEGGIFQRVIQVLQEDYIDRTQPGEHILIMTFDEEVRVVYDRPVTGPDDIRELQQRVAGLQAQRAWTWMSKALEIVSNQADRLKTQYPDERLIIYFFTDGINEPPPAAHEPHRPFVAVLSDHFAGLRDFFYQKDAFVYVFLYEHPTDPVPITLAQKEAIAQLGAQVVNIPLPGPAAAPETIPPAITPELHVIPLGFDFGTVAAGSDGFTGQGIIRIQEIRGEAAGERVELNWTGVPPGAAVPPRIEPGSFVLTAEGQAVAVRVQLPPDHPVGEYSLGLSLSAPGLRIMPASWPVDFTLVPSATPGPRPPSPVTGAAASDRVPEGAAGRGSGWWRLPLLMVLALLLAYPGYLWWRRRTLWVTRADWTDGAAVTVSGFRSTGLDAVDLPGCRLRLGLGPQDLGAVFLVSAAGHRKISWGVPMPLQGGDEGVTLVFHRSPPVPDAGSDPADGFAAGGGAMQDEDLDFFKEPHRR